MAKYKKLTRLVVERCHFSVSHGQLDYENEAELYMARQWGWITVYMGMKLECKICGVIEQDFKAIPHLQLKTHIAAKNKLIQMFLNGNGPDHPDYCEGCICLIKEDNPFEDTVENVCQLGHCYKERDIDDRLKITYALGSDLFRPPECVVFFNRTHKEWS